MVATPTLQPVEPSRALWLDSDLLLHLVRDNPRSTLDELTTLARARGLEKPFGLDVPAPSLWLLSTRRLLHGLLLGAYIRCSHQPCTLGRRAGDEIGPLCTWQLTEAGESRIER